MNFVIALLALISSSIALAQRQVPVNQLQFNYDANTLTITAAAAASPFSLVLPATQGAAGQCMVDDGAGNLSWASPITSLTGGVTATGPGAAAATVVSVGGSSAANVHTAELAANAATTLDTPSTIVARDGSGDFAISGILFNGSGSGATTVQAAATASGTLTLPALTDTMVSRASIDQGADRLKNKDLSASSVQFVDSTDTTKELKVDLSGAASGAILTFLGVQTTNRSLTYPDITDTLMARTDVATVQNKSMSGASNTFTNIPLASAVSGTLPIPNGGTNSSTALNNNRVMTSSGGAIVESAAITGNRALASTVNGIPIASAVTDTQLGYLSTTTSDVQTQINGKEPTITGGTTLQYWRGDKSFQTLNTTAVAEGTNLYYLDARARAALSGTAPVSYSTSTGVISMAAASNTVNGYLASTDWITFNNKQATVSATAPVTFSANTVGITQSGTAGNGYLSSTDWNTFNGKQPVGSYALQATAINTTAPLQGGGDLSTTRTLSITQAATAANGYLSSTDWNTFNTKVSATRAINTTAPLSGGGDLSADRTLAITQAATAANGYLSSTDWNTFNTKASNTLNNLGSVAINQDLTPASDGGFSLGTNSKNWLDVLTYQLDLDFDATGTKKLSFVRGSGGSNYTLTFPNAQGASSTTLSNNGSGVLSWVALLSNPMTTLGDLLYGGSSGTPTRLAGTTTNSIHAVLSSTATAGVANAPTLSQINATDFFTSGAAADATHVGIVTTGNDTWGGRKSAGNSKVRAHLGTNQSVSSGVETRVLFDTKDFDTNTEFDATTTKGRFTATVSGYYWVCAKLTVDALTVGTSSSMNFYKNTTRSGTFNFSQGTNPVVSGCDFFNLNGSTDFVEIKFSNSDVATRTVDSNGNDAGAVYVQIMQVL